MARIMTGNRNAVDPPSGRKLKPQQYFDLRGVDLVTPHDVLDDSHSPFSKNIRMYDREDERQVAIKTRRGPGFYTVPVGETQDDSETSTTGADDQPVNTVHWVADSFVAGADGRLTRVDINIKDDGDAIGDVLIRVYEDDGGEPGDVIAISSIQGNEIDTNYNYETARFIDAPLLSSGTTYWVSASLQEGGDNSYAWSSTTNASTALETGNSGGTWSATNVAMNMKTYIASDGRIRGLHRYYPSNNQNETLFVHGSDLYKADDNDGSVTSIVSDLNSTEEYHFGTSKDKAFFVGESTTPRYYNGTSVSDVGGSPGSSSTLAFHKNRLFLVSSSDPTRLNFSDLGDYETYGATNFLYVPSPKSNDPIQQIISFQDNLIILTKNSKWVLSGSDLGNFQLREAVGKEGLINPDAVDKTDNYIYFVSSRGLNRWSGSEDELVSSLVEPEFRNIGSEESVNVIAWENQIRTYYRYKSAPTNDRCMIFDTIYEETFIDTDAPIRYTEVLFKDNFLLVEGSDRVGALYYAEQGFSIMGKPIDFQYRTKYHSFGNSAALKQVRRFYPLLRSQDAPFSITIGVDKDLEDDPEEFIINTQGEGAVWGGFVYGDGTVYGSSNLIDPRLTIGGHAVYYQFRFSKWGADTPVELLGYMVYPRIRRPK